MNRRTIFLLVLLAVWAYCAVLSRLGLQTFASAALQGYKIEHVTTPGLNTSVITTPNGRIRVNAPSELYAGDTFTGTMQTDPGGNNESERAGNLAQLNSLVLVIGQQPTRVSEQTFARTIPNSSANYHLSIQGQGIDTSLTVVKTSPPPLVDKTWLPTGGQIGHNVMVPAPCDGLFDGSDLARIGGTELKPLAESPRMKVFQNTSQVSGPTQIEFNEHGKLTAGPFQNIGVRLSGNTNLLRGQQGPLNLVIFGLLNVQQVLPVDLVNSSTTVVGVSGGDLQHFQIRPADVSSNGEWTRGFTMTGRSVGVFNITATVRWKNPCPLEPGDCEESLPECGAGAHQCGELDKYWCTGENTPCQPPPCGAGAHQCGEGLKYWCTSDNNPCQPGPGAPPQPEPSPALPTTPPNTPTTPTGPRPSPSPFTPTEAVSPSPSPLHTPTGTPTPPPRTCTLTSVVKAGPAINGNATAPLSNPIAESNESIPLIVTASDIDQLIQTCSCPPGSQSESIDILDSVKYNWTLLAPAIGKLDAGGSASLYKPPDIPIGGKITAVVLAEVTDSGENGNDNPATAKFTITVERQEECKYKRDVKIEKSFGGGGKAEPTGQNECKPGPHFWDATPLLESKDEDISTVKMCMEEQIVLHASASDSDTLELQCTSANCGNPRKKLTLADEVKYKWKVLSGGGFLSPTGTIVKEAETNGRNTSVIYQAATPGSYLVSVEIEDSGKQGKDPKKLEKLIHIEVYGVIMEMEGVSTEKKGCKSGEIVLNNDDDNRNNKDDKDENPVIGEDDLKKIIIHARGPAALTVTSGADKIRFWDDKEKHKPAELSWGDTFFAPEVWVEGVQPGDAELVLRSKEAGCEDRIKLTVKEPPECRLKVILESVKYNNTGESSDNIGERWKFDVLVNGQRKKIPTSQDYDEIAYGSTKIYNQTIFEGPATQERTGRAVECDNEGVTPISITVAATEIARLVGADSSGSQSRATEFDYICKAHYTGEWTHQDVLVQIRERSMLPGRDFSDKTATLVFTFRMEPYCVPK